MPVIRVADHAVHWMEVGRGEPLVLLHGLGTSLASMWLSLARPLSRSRRLLLYDLRGHGKSEKASTGYDLVTLSRDLAGLLDELERGDPLDLAGYSYGGAIALRFLLDHPDRARKAILIDTPLPPYEPEDMVSLSRPWDVPEGVWSRLLGEDPDAFEDAAESVLAGFGSRQRGRRTENAARIRFETTLKGDLETVPPFDPEALSRVDVPVLCLACADSPFRAGLESLAGNLPQGRFRALPGSHFEPLFRPAGYAEAMEEFLDG